MNCSASAGEASGNVRSMERSAPSSNVPQVWSTNDGKDTSTAVLRPVWPFSHEVTLNTLRPFRSALHTPNFVPRP